MKKSLLSILLALATFASTLSFTGVEAKAAETYAVTSNYGANEDYARIFDLNYYKENNPDLVKLYGKNNGKYLAHFKEKGMAEGRKSISTFDVYAYAAANADLRRNLKNNLKEYYIHYMNHGYKENRVATGTHDLSDYATIVSGYDLSKIFDYNYYVSKYPEVKKTYGLDEGAVLSHFVSVGLKEGRIGKADDDIAEYVKYKKIGGNLLNVTTKLYGIDFRPVYDYVYYVTEYPAIAESCQYNSVRVLIKFADEGMYKGQEARKNVADKDLLAIKTAYDPYRNKSTYSKAIDRLNKVGWDLRSAFNWAAAIPYYGRNGLLPVVPDNGIGWFADFTLDNEKGNCYGKASAFYVMAQVLGYIPRQMAGMVPSARGGMTPHSWVEIDMDGKTYVFDLTYHNDKRSGYMIQYGQKGTWKYADYSQMSFESK